MILISEQASTCGDGQRLGNTADCSKLVALMNMSLMGITFFITRMNVHGHIPVSAHSHSCKYSFWCRGSTGET